MQVNDMVNYFSIGLDPKSESAPRMGFSSKPGKKDPIDFRMLYNQFFEHFNGLTSLFCYISSHRHLTADQAFLFSSCSG